MRAAGGNGANKKPCDVILKSKTLKKKPILNLESADVY